MKLATIFADMAYTAGWWGDLSSPIAEPQKGFWVSAFLSWHLPSSGLTRRKEELFLKNILEGSGCRMACHLDHEGMRGRDPGFKSWEE
jgi:hypothetical protein